MKRIKIKNMQPVWEETTTWVEVSDEDAERLLGDDIDYEYADSLLNKAISENEAHIEVKDVVFGMDSDLEITED